jgi:M6 family metalloprotease-like protein
MEPPRPGEIQELRLTGELESRLEFVRLIGNHKIDGYRARKALAKAQRRALQQQGLSEEELDQLIPLFAPPPDWRGMPTTGNVKILAILIEFQNYRHSTSRDDVHDSLFGDGNAANAPYESLATYYDRSSYQQLNLSNGSTLGWYRTAYNRPNDPGNWTARMNVLESLIKEALNYFNSQGHDFGQYDNDGDGVIDYFVVIWAGPDNGWGNLWWGFQTTFPDDTYTLDGVRLGKFSWQWESNPVGTAFTPVTVIHETGHALGLPDYYDYDGSIGPDGGVGGLDMMDAAMGDHNCFSKWMLDWITPIVVANDAQNITMSASGTSQDAVLIWPAVTTGDLFSEFFMAQNRHRVGNDNDPFMPADGMLIWRVDAHLNSSGSDFLYDNSYTSRKLLRLMEADGLEEIERNQWADSGDYYTSGKTFGPCTTPSSKKYDGTLSFVGISNISTAGVQMSANFAASFSAINVPSSDSDGSYTVSWGSAVGATSYELQRATNESFTNATTIYSGSATSYSESGRPSGSYWYRVRAVYSCGSSGWASAGPCVVGSARTPLGPDFNGDGLTDLLWQHESSGAVYVWFMNGTSYTNGAWISYGSTDTTWEIIGTADFNNDGQTDLLWRHKPSGGVYVWFMNGISFTSGAWVLYGSSDTSWEIIGTADFNNDGQTDLLWMHMPSGGVYVWFMSGTSYTNGAWIFAASGDTTWEIVSP